MEQKNNVTNNGYFNNSTNKGSNATAIKNYKKSGTKKNKIIENIIIPRIIEQNNLTIFNDSKVKQSKINQCFLDIMHTKEKREKEIKKEKNKNIFSKINKDINKMKLNVNEFDNKSNNIKVNKIKIEKINIENTNSINSKTNRDFYHKSTEEKKSININNDEPKSQNTLVSDFYDDKTTNIISVKSFNKNNFDNEKSSNHNDYSDNASLMNTFNKKINNFLYDNLKNYNQPSINTKTYNTNTTKTRSNISNNSSKILISYKNIKTFHAHLEIFICLYLKRIFKIFLEKIKDYKKPKLNNNINLELNNNNVLKVNNFRPIVNVNNAHCSLYCSINLNQDKLFNTILDNQNIYTINNNSYTPITKRRIIEETKQLTKDRINNPNKRNRLLLIRPECDTNLNSNKRYDKDYNQKSVYIPKKKISKSKTDLVNRVKKATKNVNIKNNNIKSFPIKEMNINLKQINVCRLNELNHLYLNQNLYKSNNNCHFNFTETTPIIKINNNNLTNHSKYNSNNINSMNNTSNISSDKNKLKKIKSAKNGIYTKPKEKNKENKIKEIKIQNKLTPLKKDIDNKKYKNDNLLSTCSFNKIKNYNDMSKIKNTNLYTINNNKDENTIKKIYIKTKQKSLNNFNLKEDIFDSYNKQFYSTFLSYKTNNENNFKDVNNEILVKQITTSDKRLFINVKYYILMDNNYIKRQSNLYTLLNLKFNHQDSISIVDNKFNNLNREYYNNILLNKCNNNNLKMLDIYSFDNDKNEKIQKIKSKNISFSFKDCSRSKEETHDIKVINEELINFINKLKRIIIINIRKNLYLKFKIKICLLKIIKNKQNSIIKSYFSKYKDIVNNKLVKIDRNSCGIYHKINYNDDFNLNKKLKVTKNNIPKNDYSNAQCKTKVYNLTLHNSINQFNNKKINDKKRIKEFSPNNNTKKIINKEINIIVHNNTKVSNNTNNSILLNKLKNKFFF